MKKIVITGGSGFFGTFLIKELLAENPNYHVVVMDLIEPKVNNDRVSFFKHNLLDSFDGKDCSLLESPFAYFHLSGKNIFGSFTEKHKKEIYDTRIIGTRNLLNLFTEEKYKPQKLIAASAVGYYGSQPVNVINESSSIGTSFLAQVVDDWEHEVHKGRDMNISTHCIRNAHIIGQGGILSVVSSYASYGFGAILGNGKSHFPWIDILDLCHIYMTFLQEGNHPLIINGVSGTSDTHADFGKAVGRAKKVLFNIHIPRLLLRVKFGSFADEMLVDQRVSTQYEDFSPVRYTNLIERINHYLK